MIESRIHRFHVGSATVTVLDDGPITAPASFLFANAESTELASALAAMELDAQAIPAGLAGMLVELAGGERILFDAGTGGRWHEGLGRLPQALEAAGCLPGDVDLVIVSHGHPDHLGGLIDDAGHPRYANARHVMSRAEHDFWTSDATLRQVEPEWAQLARQVLPSVRDHLWLTRGSEEVASGVWTLPSPGHTPGHIGARLDSEGQTLLWLGDAFGHPLGIAHPEWSVATDMHADRSERTRHELIGAAAALQATVFVNHFAFPAIGRIARPGDEWRWRPGDRDTLATTPAAFV